MKGKVFLIGAGPGDPGLITVKGLELLRSAEVVVYDALIDPKILNECKNAEMRDAGKRGGNHTMTQSETNAKLVELAKGGKRVVRLKGGDPFMFGRGAEEAAELRKEGIDVYVVPGVSSSIAVPELAGIPLTHRDSASMVTIVTGHERSDRDEDRTDWKKMASMGGTIVVMMGIGNSKSISKRLMDGGLPGETPAAVITMGSTEKQRSEVMTLASLHDVITSKGIEAPGVIVIGDVVKQRGILGDMF
jgi:uroporphyrin-III C-methyltransferase